MTSLGDAGRLLTIEEAARQFRVSVSTMYRWCRTGRLPAFKIGRGWLIPLGSVPGRPGERF
ncbi:MAG TPA: helix-turn-helix domain-containing protein, partial [Dehalococcoidia bacterium]|nr:helix-turn-helix domain-containing protein [Dehalococcoidia bacterium]